MSLLLSKLMSDAERNEKIISLTKQKNTQLIYTGLSMGTLIVSGLVVLKGALHLLLGNEGGHFPNNLQSVLIFSGITWTSKWFLNNTWSEVGEIQIKLDSLNANPLKPAIIPMEVTEAKIIKKFQFEDNPIKDNPYAPPKEY